ncbi:MAG: AraC family transcriptional regulator [Trichococcus sp.]
MQKKDGLLSDFFEIFDSYINENGVRIYRYTFEKILKSAEEKQKERAAFIEGSQLLILKHARFSYTPFHTHDFIEMNYVYSGTINIIIDGNEITLKEGDFCILDTSVCHRILDTGEDDIMINFLMRKEYFSTQMLSRLASNNIITRFAVNALSKTQEHDRYLLFNTPNSEFLIDAIEGMLVNYYDPSFYSEDVTDAYMIIIFSELLKAFQKQQSSEHRKADQSYIGDILLFIEQNYQDCSLQQIADIFKFNPSYLSRFIKSQAGKSYVALVQELRLNNACILLKNTDTPIETISEQIGYRNVTFFYQKFKQAYDMTPHEYRMNVN